MTAQRAAVFKLKEEESSMSATVKVLAIVDSGGRVLAAQFAGQSTGPPDEEVPTPNLLPLEGQRVVSFDVPQEVLELPGPDLHHFLSHLTISWSSDVQVPKIEIVKET
jgi:hypothetical protein